MDMPIGALGDGFEDRLVLESRTELARWGGCLLYLLMVPFTWILAIFLSLILTAAVGFCIASDLDLRFFYVGSIVVFFAAFLRLLFREYRTRDYQEIALRGSLLEISGRPTALEVADIKTWPHGLSFLCATGQRYMVRSLAEEKKLKALERVLPDLAAAHIAVLEAGQEIRLQRNWGRLADILCQGFFAGGLLLALGLLVHLMVGIVLGVTFWCWFCFPVLRDFSNPGLIFSRTGVRKLGQALEHEVPWREVQSAWAGAFFQDTLRVATANGLLTLVSGRNPVVWALVIRELKARD